MLLVTITLVCCSLCGLIRYEADNMFGTVQLQGLMRSTECSSQGVWMTEAPSAERVDEVPPRHLITQFESKRDKF